MTTLRLLRDVPASIEPLDCLAVRYTVLTAPACSIEAKGLEVEYAAPDWVLRVNSLTEGK